MSSLAELPELHGFFSYSRDDDEDFEGTLSALRNAIHRELRAQLGRHKTNFRLWQDTAAIAIGQDWESEIRKAVEQSTFFIPIVTPRAVNSKYCKFEFESFLGREQTLGRDDLIFPILYITVAALENEAVWRANPVLSIIARRQYFDWRPERHFDIHSTAARAKIEAFCRNIVDALNQPWISPEERRRIEEANAQQLAEEKRLEAEARRAASLKQAEAEARERADRKRAEDERRAAEARQLAEKAEARRVAAEEQRLKQAEAEARQLADRERAEAERRAAEEESGRKAEAEALERAEKARARNKGEANRRARTEEVSFHVGKAVGAWIRRSDRQSGLLVIAIVILVIAWVLYSNVR
jgi:TIR domain